jgi:hypothetical protein
MNTSLFTPIIIYDNIQKRLIKNTSQLRASEANIAINPSTAEIVKVILIL